MRVKTKILLGLTFLFVVIVALSVISIGYINELNVKNQKLLKDDYRSLENVHGMQLSLNEIRSAFEPDSRRRRGLILQEGLMTSAIQDFEEYLKQQKLSIGVETEERLVNGIARDLEDLKAQVYDINSKDLYFEKLLPITRDIDQKVDRIYQLNRKNIELQDEAARATALQVIYTVAAIMAICIIATFIFILRFPGFVAKPIEKLSEAMEDIKAGNYDTEVSIGSKDEFGELGEAFNQMTHKLAEYEKVNLNRLLTEKGRIETMIRKLPEGIIGLDNEFRLLFINPFARELLGLSDLEIDGQHGSELASQSQTLELVLEDLLEYGRSGKRYTRNKLIKGNLQDKPAYFIRRVILTYGQSSEEDDSLDGYILMLKNITEYKEQDEARNNFIATVSHELKTPIAAIKLSLKLLKDRRLSTLTKDQEELVDAVEWEVNRLLNITQELLNANELESGRIQLHPDTVKVEEILAEAVDSVLTVAEDRKIQIEEEVENGIPLLHLDQNKVSWVLVNFLTNAIKYSPVHSKVQLHVFQEEGQLVFKVIDHGRGIPLEEQQKIFDRFYRIKGSDGQGTGLGLSISKEIVTQMGGSIGVESVPGEGSTFYIRIPAPFAEAQA